MNYVISWFGGKEGCLGILYTPTLQELLAEEHRRLLRAARKMDRELVVQGKALETLKEKTQNEGKKGRMEVARRSALDLYRTRLSYDRLGGQRDNLMRVADRVKQQMSSASVDGSLLLITRVMAARLQQMDPRRFATMMNRYEELRSRQEVNEERINEIFAAEEDAESEGIADAERNDDQKAALIFAELGLIDDISVPSDPPIEASSALASPPPKKSAGMPEKESLEVLQERFNRLTGDHKK